MEIWTVTGGRFPRAAYGQRGARPADAAVSDRFTVTLESADGRQILHGISSDELDDIKIGRSYVIKDGRLLRAIHVAAAVICQDHRVFATQRGYGEQKDGWEFPGGKLEKGETAEAALIREIREELAATITVDRFLTRIEYDYPDFHLSMDCFLCSLAEGTLTLLEHEASAWLSAEELDLVDWLPADRVVLPEVLKVLGT